MAYDSLTLISNYIYLIAGIILLIKKHLFFGCVFIILWFVSHKHHSNMNNDIWHYIDSCFALFCFAVVLYKCWRKINCAKNLLYLVLILSFYIMASTCWYEGNMKIYYVWHSLWHIISGLFVMYIILI
jgi:hypothetical protein